MKKWLFITLLITALVSSTAFYTFSSHFPDLPGKLNLAISYAIFVPQIVAVWAILTSLGAFKRNLKVAYGLLMIALVFLSLNQLQLLVSSFVTIDPISLSWFITGSTLMGSLLLYLSMRQFARTLSLQNKPWGSILFATIFALALASLSALIPHNPFPGVKEMTLDGIFGIYTAGTGFAFCASILAWQARSKLSASYRPGMTWLVAAAGLLAFSSLHETILRLVPIFSREGFAWYSIYGVSLWPLFFVGFAFLGAGLSFKKISRERAQLPADATALDVVTYIAGLASEPRAIDVILDDVRKISVEAGTELTKSHEQTLGKVYLRLERYLTTQERLRTFTTEDLRSRLPESFQQNVKAAEHSRGK